MPQIEKVKRYARIRYTVAIADTLYLLALLVIFQVSGLSVDLRTSLSAFFQNDIALIFFYSLAIYIFYLILNFPVVFYRSFMVEHQFDLTRQKFPQWFSDFLKGNALSFIFFLILTESFYYFLRQYPGDWWWITSSFWIFLSVIISRIFPVLIIPIFFKYKRVEDEDLRKRILALSEKMRINLLDIYEIDFSKKSLKANAALVGLGRSKRVILTDTLKGKFSHEEIEVILAHEFAHSRLRHMIKLIMISAAGTLAAFYLAFKASPAIFANLNLNITDIAALPMWLILSNIFEFVSTPAINYLSRKMESNADRLALEYSKNPAAFISMMEKLTEMNLSERRPHPVIKFLYYDHPPVDERIAMARKRFV